MNAPPTKAELDKYGMRLAPLSDSDRRWCEATKHTAIGRVEFDVVIKRVADGVERKHTDSRLLLLGPNGDKTLAEVAGHAAFWWRDGNGSCDCNRHISFEGSVIDVAGTELASVEPDDTRCGDGAYAVISPAWMADE